MIHLCDAPTPLAARGTIYLPFVATPTTPTFAGLSPTCAAFLRLLLDDERQQHPTLAVCPSLIASATQRAEGLANGQPWAHCDADGVCANQYVRRAGCVLPDWYAENGNQVESLSAGSSDPVAIFNALASSEKHAPHLFGWGWFRHQTHIGIAMAAGGTYGWYWAVHICLCGVSSGE